MWLRDHALFVTIANQGRDGVDHFTPRSLKPGSDIHTSSSTSREPVYDYCTSSSETFRINAGLHLHLLDAGQGKTNISAKQ